MLSNYIETFALSLIQGIFEFLPISSSAHLLITSEIFNFKSSSLIIDISLHLGSLLAIIFYFRKDLVNFFKKKNIELLRPHKRVENVKIIREYNITFFAP